VLAAFEDLVRGHARIAEAVPVLRGDGTVFHADISTSLLTYRGRLAVLGIFRDITERARAEAALRASEERYRAVVEDQTEVICRFTADGTLTFVNDVFCRFFGKACNELIGRKWQPVVMPEEPPPMVERQLLAMSPANPIAVIENRIRSDRGEIRWMQFVYRGFFDPSGRLVEVQAVGRDVTDLKKAQEALAREHRALKRLLQSSDHERRLIAYEIHDGLAQQLAGALMQFETYAYQKDKLPEFADRAFEAGMAMLRQAHFETRRLISGVRPPILDEAGIMAAISHLVNEEQRKGGPRIELHGRIEHERLSPILENAIYRIVQEALANACQHSQSELVVVSLTQECCKIRIEVRDQGIGFDPEAIAENQFGVAGIRERARLLGGIATIESSPGQGTRIAVELPLIFPNEANAGTPGRDTISKREKSP
jgi:PAS domain S-box-containing protein